MNRQDASALDAAFEARVQDIGFPCVGAKSALAQGSLVLLQGEDIRCPASDEAIVAALQEFGATAPVDAVFVSRVVLFPGTPPLDEAAFEQALWQRLQAFHAIDARHFDWDPAVSSDPANPRFSMSIGGRGFYVVGLHPGASRPARRFHCAALVFNLHSQFEALRADGRYEKLREAITERDIAFSGSRNPMLAVHGKSSEARQYSGRKVDANWRCPFSPQAGSAGPAHGP